MLDVFHSYKQDRRHYGFIYNEYTNARNIAHELAHGTNALHHTFSQESESFYTTKETDNLMDYNGGTTLTHSQWQWSHEKHRNVLGFLDDEGEGEMLAAISVVQILEAIKIDNQKGNNCTDLSLWAGKKSFENKLTLSDNLILEYIDVNIALTKNANNKNNPLQIEPLQINPILLHTTKVEVSSGEDEQFVKIYYNRIGKKTLAETSASEQNEEAISFVIKESQLDELKTYLNLMQTADATWVSQFNKNIFGNCSCWRGSCCFQCSQYIVKNSTNMYSPAASRVVVMKFPIAKRPLAEMQTPILAGDLQQAIDYINKSIAENKPVVAGVYYRKKQEDIKRNVDKILPNLNEERKKLAKILHDIEYEENNIDLLREKEQGQHKVDSLQAKYDKANKMPYNAIEPTFHFIVIDGKGFDVNKKQYYYHFLEVGTESNMKGTNENNRLYIYNNEIKGTRGFDTREYILTEIRKHSLSGDACP